MKQMKCFISHVDSEVPCALHPPRGVARRSTSQREGRALLRQMPSEIDKAEARSSVSADAVTWNEQLNHIASLAVGSGNLHGAAGLGGDLSLDALRIGGVGRRLVAIQIETRSKQKAARVGELSAPADGQVLAFGDFGVFSRFGQLDVRALDLKCRGVCAVGCGQCQRRADGRIGNRYLAKVKQTEGWVVRNRYAVDLKDGVLADIGFGSARVLLPDRDQRRHRRAAGIWGLSDVDTKGRFNP